MAEKLTRKAFIAQADEAVSGLSKDGRGIVLHRIAEALPAAERQNFLSLLDRVREECGQEDAEEAPDLQDEEVCGEEDGEDGLSAEIAGTLETLRDINEGKLMIDSTWNEDWDGYEEDDGRDYDFSDPMGVMDEIEEAVDLLSDCIAQEDWTDGRDLALALSSLRVYSDGDYDSYEGLQLEDLDRLGLLDTDVREVARRSLYLVYMGDGCDAPDKRTDDLYAVIRAYEVYDIKLRDVLDLGEDEPSDLDAFLSDWISFLGNSTARGSQQLLEDALSMGRERQIAPDAADAFAENHPELYVRELESGQDGKDAAAMQREGQRALERIPVTLVIRARAALLTADYALQAGDPQAAGDCRLEALRSDTTAQNFLRVLLYTQNREKDLPAAQEICREAYDTILDRSWYDTQESTDPLRRNVLRMRDWCAILFFEQEFDAVIREGLSVEKPLGWTYSFMKTGIALFMLLAWDGDSAALPAGLLRMQALACDGIGLDPEWFLSGTGDSARRGMDARTLFRSLFLSWKKEVTLSAEQVTRIISLLEELVRKRVDGIMEANRRDHYGECAGFIAALGEVLESRHIRSRADVIGDYRAAYPRRRAFLAALDGVR